MERGDDRRDIIEQAPVVVRSGRSVFSFAHGCGGRDRPFREEYGGGEHIVRDDLVEQASKLAIGQLDTV